MRKLEDVGGQIPYPARCELNPTEYLVCVFESDYRSLKLCKLIFGSNKKSLA